MTIIKHQKFPLNQSSVIGYFAVFMMIIYIVLPISICTVNIYFFKLIYLTRLRAILNKKEALYYVF